MQDSVETRRGSRGGSRHDMKDGKTGGLCPTCNQTMSLTEFATTVPDRLSPSAKLDAACGEMKLYAA